MSTKYKETQDVPTDVICERLESLAKFVTQGIGHSEFSMRIPAELDRDADIVLFEAAKRLKRIAELESAMQEFVDKPSEKLTIPETKYFKYKFKQLLREKEDDQRD